jgi:hypothetical protein
MAAAYPSDVISDECNHSESRHGEARFLAQVRWCMYYGRRDIRAVGFQLDRDSKNEWISGDAGNNVGESLGYRLDSLYS